MKQPRRVSYRQLQPLDSEIAIRVDERIRREVIDALADLLVEELGARSDESTEGKK